MEPTIGRVVIFNVPEDMRLRNNFADQAPAVIVRIFEGGLVNLKVIADGTDDIWVTSVHQGDGVNQWNWPVIK